MLDDIGTVPHTHARGPCKGNIVEAAGTVVVNGIEWPGAIHAHGNRLNVLEGTECPVQCPLKTAFPPF